MTVLKKLLYKSNYRGTKEGDFILSLFAKSQLEKCSPQEITSYEALLEYTDSEIQDWIINPEKSPSHLRQVVQKIAAFHKLD